MTLNISPHSSREALSVLFIGLEQKWSSYSQGRTAIFISTAAHMNDSRKPRGSEGMNFLYSLFYYKKKEVTILLP